LERVVFLANSELNREISQKKQELQHLVTKKKNIQDREVYMKSVELDYLVVEFMRKKTS
jgi:heme oxygenase